MTGFEDWLPTLLELVGEKVATPKDIDGISFAPTLLGTPQDPRPFLYRELPGYGGQQCARVGDWKAVRQKPDPKPRQDKTPKIVTELYDLATDPAEKKNTAAEHPEIVAQLEKVMQDQHSKSDMFPIRVLDENSPKPSRPPNILFILADDLGWGDASVQGHPYMKTPNIDALAGQGTFFRQFYVGSPICSASRCALMTGHFPSRHHITAQLDDHKANAARGMPDWLDTNVVTITKLLKDAGYVTGHFGKWHLGGAKGSAR